MTSQSQRSTHTFERKAGRMPALKRAAPPPAAEPAEAEADQLAEVTVPGFLSQKEILLRLVETLKSL